MNQHFNHSRTGATDQKLSGNTLSVLGEIPHYVKKMDPGPKGHILMSDYDDSILFDVEQKKIVWANKDCAGGHHYLYKDKIIAAAWGRTAEINPKTGKFTKKYNDNKIYPVLYKNYMIRFANASMKVLDLDKKSKTILQSKLLGQVITRLHPVFADGKVWFTSETNTQYANRNMDYYLNGIDIDSGEHIIEKLDFEPIENLLEHNGIIYQLHEKYLVAYDTKKEKMAFKMELTEREEGNFFKPCIKGDTMYIYSQYGKEQKILQIDLKTQKMGEPLIEIKDEDITLDVTLCVLDNQLILIDSYQIFSINLDKKKPTLKTILKNPRKEGLGSFACMTFSEGAFYFSTVHKTEKAKAKARNRDRTRDDDDRGWFSKIYRVGG